MSEHRVLILFEKTFDPHEGGLERVYSNLIAPLKSAGCHLFALYGETSESPVACEFEEAEKYEDGYRPSLRLKEQIAAFCSRNGINVIIVPVLKPGIPHILPSSPLKFYHIHNKPSAIFVHPISRFPKSLRQSSLGKLMAILNARRKIISSLRVIDSDSKSRIVLLSDHFRSDINRLYHFKNDTILAVPNPVPKAAAPAGEKEKLLIYVGRLELHQKRVDLLLKIWQRIQDFIPDWQLKVLGDGPDKGFLESMAAGMKLKRCSFTGRVNPSEYYERASALCMTSAFEGFPMVLPEAMQKGCVPFAFNSFEALPDIIDDGVDGFICQWPDVEAYSRRILDFVNSPESRKQALRQKAIDKAASFDASRIAKIWIGLFDTFSHANVTSVCGQPKIGMKR